MSCTLRLSASLSARIPTSVRSISTASRFFAFSERADVNAPSPGPISSTFSPWQSASAAMRLIASVSIRKFCPRALFGVKPSFFIISFESVMTEILMQICIYVNIIRKIMRILRVFYPKKLIADGKPPWRFKKDCRRANNHVQRQLMLNALSLKKTENSESKHDIAADDINHGQCGFTYSHFGSIIIMHDYSSKDLKTKELNRGMSIEV